MEEYLAHPDFKDKTCPACDKKIGDVDVYWCKKCEEGANTYHQGCKEKKNEPKIIAKDIHKKIQKSDQKIVV